jgi:hypothetical protein
MKAIIAILGQSNEQGPGPSTSISSVMGAGAPSVDPIGPQGAFNSPWPHLAKMAAARGHWYAFRNHARGSTALTDLWVGRCRAYAFGMNLCTGAYVLDGGNIYKAVGAIGTIYSLNVAPSAGVGASGLSSWTNLGAAQAGDTDGAIYAEGSARFDPNGLIAAINTDLGLQVGYDRKAVFVSIGQSDKTVISTSAQYSAAMQSVANYFKSRGIYVFLGFTCYAASVDAWYTSDLLPGRAAALAAQTGPLVMAGADLRTALGVLATTPATGIGLQADAIHMNADGMLAAGRAWDTQLASLGW